MLGQILLLNEYINDSILNAIVNSVYIYRLQDVTASLPESCDRQRCGGLTLQRRHPTRARRDRVQYTHVSSQVIKHAHTLDIDLSK